MNESKCTLTHEFANDLANLIPNKETMIKLTLANKLIKNDSIILTIPDGGNFEGIEHLDIFQSITFILSNYKTINQIEGKLIDNVWKISPYLLPLSKLIEYSNDIKLEVEIKLNKQKKKRFYNFNAFFQGNPSSSDSNVRNESKLVKLSQSPDSFKNITNQSMFLDIPTFDPNINIQFICGIWRVIKISPSE